MGAIKNKPATNMFISVTLAPIKAKASFVKIELKTANKIFINFNF